MRPTRSRCLRIALVAGFVALGGMSVACSAGRSGEPTRAASPVESAELHLLQPRAVHRAVPLPDGSVLFLGGCTTPGCGGFEEGRVTEVFRPESGMVPGPALGVGRAGATATLLRDGRVLVAGGYPGEGRAPTASIELVDPATGGVTELAPLLVARADHSASLLPDGRVLVAGGVDPRGKALRSTEIIDPTGAGQVEPGAPLGQPRAAHVAVALDDRVVLVGGTRQVRALGTTEVFDGRSWAAGPDLLTARVKHGAVALTSGRVLVVGGSASTEGRRRLASTELLDLTRTRSTAGPTLTVAAYKLDGAVAVLADGRVVVAAGDGLDVLDPAAATVSRLDAVVAGSRSFRTVTALADGTVLVAGGYNDAIRPTDEAVVVSLPAPAAAPTR